jgi:hypothetical protein
MPRNHDRKHVTILMCLKELHSDAFNTDRKHFTSLMISISSFLKNFKISIPNRNLQNSMSARTQLN